MYLIGKTVESRIKEYGYKKCYVCKWINISRPTLDRRLKDGNFTDEQISILKNKDLI